MVDHAPSTIAASYDKALLWTTMKTVLMREYVCQLTASKQDYISDIFRLYYSYWSLKPTDFNGGCGLAVRYARLFTIAQARTGPK